MIYEFTSPSHDRWGRVEMPLQSAAEVGARWTGDEIEARSRIGAREDGKDQLRAKTIYTVFTTRLCA